MPGEENFRSRERHGNAGHEFGTAKWKTVRVILVSQGPSTFFHLTRSLEARGFRCGSVTTYSEAVTLLRSEGFDLLIGVAPLPRGTVSLLANSVALEHASFFCVQPVEDGCWWVPVYHAGAPCLGTPALRPAEFSNFLDALVAEASRVPATLEPRRHQAAPSTAYKDGVAAPVRPVRADRMFEAA